LKACQEEVAYIRGIVDTRADVTSFPAADLQEVMDAFQLGTGVVIHWHKRGRLRFRKVENLVLDLYLDPSVNCLRFH
jgi:hypothetical protein